MWLKKIDRWMITEMRAWGEPSLRVTLGIVFLWFGALKLFGVTPVAELIAQTWGFVPIDTMILVLAVWEITIGIGLLSKQAMRLTLGLLWLQMLGTVLAVLFAPHLFFQDNNPLLLTIYGEFIVKNFVLIAAGLVIGGHDVKK